MLLETDTTFAAAMVWLLALIVCWAYVPRWSAQLFRTTRFLRHHPLLSIAAAAAIARGAPALFLDRGLPFDISAHRWIGSIAVTGQNVYTVPLAQGRYPYPPLHMVLSALLVRLSDADAARFLVLDKLLPAAFGVGLSCIVWATARHLGQHRTRALCAGLLYALNPIAVLVTSYHGQFEEIPLCCIAFAALLLLPRRGDVAATHGSREWGPHGAALVLSALALGLAVAYKTWPLLFLPGLVLLVRGPRARIAYPLLALLPLAASVGLFGLSFGTAGMRDVLARLAGYQGSAGFCWGYVSALRGCWIQDGHLQTNAWVLTVNKGLLPLALLGVGLLLLWRQRPLDALVGAPLAFLLFSPGWGPNYAVWVLPFVPLLSLPLARLYTAVVLPIVALTYLDSLYAAYAHYDFSWAVLKPVEAVLGVAAWVGVALIVARFYLPPRDAARWQVRARGVDTSSQQPVAG